MESYLYDVGETVGLVARAGPHLNSHATYTVTRRLPEVGAELQYRIKGDHENFERVVRQYEIVASKAPPLLAETSFSQAAWQRP